MTQIVFLRHGETDWNRQRRFQGQTDVPLNTVGRRQATTAAEEFGQAPGLIVSSDLSRAHKTALALADRHEMSVLLDADLRETHGGQWEGLTHHEISALDAAGFAAWRRSHSIRPGVTGELMTEVADRVVAAVNRGLAQTPPGATLVVVTHGGSARGAIGSLIGLPPEQWRSLGVLGNCRTATLAPENESLPQRRWMLTSLNA